MAFRSTRQVAAWLDPVMGIAGAALVAVWAKGLMTPGIIGKRLAVHDEIAHSTIEVHYRDG